MSQNKSTDPLAEWKQYAIGLIQAGHVRITRDRSGKIELDFVDPSISLQSGHRPNVLYAVLALANISSANSARHPNLRRDLSITLSPYIADTNSFMDLVAQYTPTTAAEPAVG